MSFGGGGGGAFRILSRIHLPRTTGDVRVAYDVTVRIGPLAKQPFSRLVGHVNPPKVASIDIRNAVVLREPFIHERIIRSHQVEDVAVFANDALEEHFALAPEGLPQVVVEIGELHRIWLMIR